MNSALRRRETRVVLGCAIALACVAATPPHASADRSANTIIDLPVSFQVANTNSSGVACPSDGASYTVRGHLTGPRAALDGPEPREVTFYVQGYEESEWEWRLDIPGYDYSSEMARLGHVSLTVDMLGHWASDKPNGQLACFGSQADVIHQIVGQLRSGAYAVDGGMARSFQRVVLAGQDVGGPMAQVEAYSYKDIDGLIVMVWADQGFTPYIQGLFANANAACAAGGENADGGGPGGYVSFGGPNDEFRQIVASPNTDTEVVEAIMARRTKNPCGYVTSTLSTIGADQARLGEVDVPVLIAYPASNPITTPEGEQQQAGLFSGSDDVTTAIVEDSSHFMMLARSAPTFRATISDWLRSRGFAGTGPARASSSQPVKKCRFKKRHKGNKKKCP